MAEPDLIVRALRESEATDLEEAMLRDKLAETDHREIEQVIENQVVRDSYYEYLSQITLPVCLSWLFVLNYTTFTSLMVNICVFFM